MIIQYASDLHLEFPQNKRFLENNPIEPKGDILLLAGDIVPFAVMNEHKDFFSYISDNFLATYWVPGNHEYYHSDIVDKPATFQEKIRDNVFLVNNISIQHDEIQFIFSTLWSEIKPASQWQIEMELSDFHVIKHEGNRFTSNQFNQLHQESLSFLKNELNSKPSDKKIVVSHHVPTLYNYPEEFKGNVLNEAFAVELYGLIEDRQPDFWIYGHTHVNTSEFTLGKTQLLTNQLGYVKYNEHGSFSSNKLLSI